MECHRSMRSTCARRDPHAYPPSRWEMSSHLPGWGPLNYTPGQFMARTTGQIRNRCLDWNTLRSGTLKGSPKGRSVELLWYIDELYLDSLLRIIKTWSISEARTLKRHVVDYISYHSLQNPVLQKECPKKILLLWNMFLTQKCVVCRKKKSSKCSSSRISFISFSF